MTPNPLRKLREGTGLNQSAFWGAIGVTQSGGSRYEMGRTVPLQVLALVGLRYIRQDRSRTNQLMDDARDLNNSLKRWSKRNA